MNCRFAVKSAWLLVMPTANANFYLNAGFVHGDAEILSRAGMANYGPWDACVLQQPSVHPTKASNN